MGQFFILRSRVQQEYNNLLVNALNRIFKSNLSLNNFKWLLTKLELSCVRNIIPRSKSGASKSRPRWAAHTRIGNVWEYPPPPRALTSARRGYRGRRTSMIDKKASLTFSHARGHFRVSRVSLNGLRKKTIHI